MLGNKQSKTALIVEDSPSQALHLGRLLIDNGISAVWARDGREGLHRAQSLHPAVAILDIFMPGGMNGLQLCKRLKEDRSTRSILVILLTKHGDKESARFGLKCGAIEYIPKDAFADKVLLETLKQQGLCRVL